MKNGLASYQLPNWPAIAIWRKGSLPFQIGIVLLSLHVLAATVGTFITPYGPTEIGTATPLSGMSVRHLFGVDMFGRDVLSRVLYGGHIVILLSLTGTLLGLTIGAAIGLSSAYMGGWIDEIIQRVIEALICIPFIVFGLLLVYAAGPQWAGQPALMVIVICIIYVPRTGRMARSAALDIITRDYVLAARLRGKSTWAVVWFELAPNAVSTLLVEFAVRCAYAPAYIAALGFLGFGVQPPTPEWGSLIAENRSALLLSPVVVVAPGLCLASLVVAINLVAEEGAHLLGYRVKVTDR